MSAVSGHQLVIVAGGYGTRLAEETVNLPKPMVEIGGRPILWHIMKIYAHHGVSEFIICAGYKGYLIKEYFANQFLHTSDVTINTGNGDITYHAGDRDNWQVTVLDTGQDTMTGGRLKRTAKYLKPDQPFFFTYGDGVSDVDIAAQLKFHQDHGKLATVTSVAQPGRFGNLAMDGNQVTAFKEKPKDSQERINGGFFVFQPQVLEYIAGDDVPLETTPLNDLAKAGELMAWEHNGYWQMMDTLRDRNVLEASWAAEAPWRVWQA